MLASPHHELRHPPISSDHCGTAEVLGNAGGEVKPGCKQKKN